MSERFKMNVTMENPIKMTWEMEMPVEYDSAGRKVSPLVIAARYIDEYVYDLHLTRSGRFTHLNLEESGATEEEMDMVLRMTKDPEAVERIMKLQEKRYKERQEEYKRKDQKSFS